jgi:hypothetical protein
MTETPSVPAAPVPGSQVVESEKEGAPSENAPIPKVYRTMKRDDDGYPTVEPTAKGLGVRTGIDIDVDQAGNVVLNDKGMSVAPGWRMLLPYRIPKRLRHLHPPARGADDVHCFVMGTGAFQRGTVAQGLELIPDSPTHGIVAPTKVVPLAEYEADLEATRTSWQVDET